MKAGELQNNIVDPVRRYATLTFIRGALVSLCITACAGILAVLIYLPITAELMPDYGKLFTSIRPIHTTFASAWIFLGGIAVVHHYMQDHGGTVSKSERIRLFLQVLCWLAAGTGILVTLAMGIFSGREYMGHRPEFSLLILIGWLFFTWNFFSATWRGFWSRPVYVTMWGVAVLFFIVTFLEQHLWLLNSFFSEPIVDLRVQWKATGTLIGSFNLFVYGSLYYIGEKLSSDDRYAHSRMAYALLAVGLLNSFTNYVHHTYHIPQNDLVKWISFVVSMTEIIILARVVWDIGSMVSNRNAQPFRLGKAFVNATKWWTAAMLFSALLLSIPKLNAIVHGTHFVTAHAMGTEIGIDSMLLFATTSWILAEILRLRTGKDGVLHTTYMRRLCILLNISAASMVIWLHVWGIIEGVPRYYKLPEPDWIRPYSTIIFACTGLATAACLALMLVVWMRLAFSKFQK